MMINPFYSWLKELENKEIEVFTIDDCKDGVIYAGKLLYLDKNMVVMKERNRVYIFPLSYVKEISIPEELFKIKSKVKVKELKTRKDL